MIVKKVEPISEGSSVLEVVERCTPYGWEKVFEKAKGEIEFISNTLQKREKEKRILPLKKDIFNAFHLTSLNRVRVVIVGQDPYPEMTDVGIPRAQGLAFSVSKNDTIPASLINIFQELKLEYPDYQIPYHGDLREWAYQGVLLLNMSLTVDVNAPASHKSIWMGFIDKVISAINESKTKMIYLLWGSKAQDAIMPLLDNKCVVLSAGHPSSKNKFNADEKFSRFSFLGCGHFKQVNELLVSRNETPIKWQLSTH